MNIMLTAITLLNGLPMAAHDHHEHEEHGHEELSGHAHEHGGDGGWFSEYLQLLQDPAHIAFEITISILFDLFIVYLGYQLFIKRVLIPRLRRDLHKELDAEHGVDHCEYEPGGDLHGSESKKNDDSPGSTHTA
jgi:hypothetical protein